MNVEIIKFDHFGRGIARIDNKVYFVNNALPKEIVKIKVIKEKKYYTEAEITKIIKPSIYRKESNCPYYLSCGGCNLLHMDYNLEKQFKIEKAMDIIGKCDSFKETKSLFYRNKVTLHIKDNKIGYYKEKTHDIVPINSCLLLSKKINEIIKEFQKYNLSTISLKKVIIKEINNHTLMNLEGSINDEFIKTFSFVDNIILNNKIIKGQNYLEEVIDNKTFHVTSESFFQVNREGLENIYSIIKEFLYQKNINSALDLYSGTSLWGILISSYVNRITCVESNLESCKNAQINIDKNHIENIKIINGKVEDNIDKFKNIDLIIIDPPRSGLDKKTKKYIHIISPFYIIYISCGMDTLKRDLKDLSNYNLKEVHLVDMFRGTYHCEVVTILERK